MPRGLGLGLCCAVGLLGSCTPVPDAPDWREEQLVARSPCYEVDLLDGLDESSTAEVRALFDCLDHHGHLASLRPTAASFDDPTRSGAAVGVELARVANALPEAGVDPFALAGVALELLRAEDRPIEELLDVGVEVIYGRAASDVRGGAVGLDEVEGGLLAPLAPVLPVAASALLDDDLETAGWLGDVIAGDDTELWVRTLDAMARSERAAVKLPVDALLEDAGDAVLATRSPGNDRWSGASGDSLRDLADVLLLDSAPAFGAVAPDAATVLSDAVVRIELEELLVDRHRGGVLQGVPAGVRYMASVDRSGGSLEAGEISALAAFVRLLRDTNRPMRCTIDVWITDVEVDLGNVAVALLEYFADRTPQTVETSSAIFGALIDWPVSDWLINEIAESGTCSAFTPQVASDLKAIDRLHDDETEELLDVFLGALKVLKYAEKSRIPELADIASALHDEGAVAPLEEVVRDVADEPLVQDLIDLVPVLADPEAYGLASSHQDVIDLQDVLLLARWFVAKDAGRTGWDRLRPVARPVLREDGTWEALGNGGRLLADRDSESSRALDLLPALVDADPDLALLADLGPLLGRADLAGPLLRVMEQPGVSEHLLASAPESGQSEVPLAFGGRLLVNGALEDLLRLMDSLMGDLEG